MNTKKDIPLNKVLGMTVTYLDYLGEKQIGTVVYVEQGQGKISDDGTIEDINWLYIKSEKDIENDKCLMLPNGQSINYCELRPSIECYIDR